MSRVLVVDDDNTIRDTLYELLSEQYICQTAETAEKAVPRLEADAYEVVLKIFLATRLKKTPHGYHEID